MAKQVKRNEAFCSFFERKIIVPQCTTCIEYSTGTITFHYPIKFKAAHFLFVLAAVVIDILLVKSVPDWIFPDRPSGFGRSLFITDFFCWNIHLKITDFKTFLKNICFGFLCFSLWRCLLIGNETSKPSKLSKNTWDKTFFNFILQTLQNDSELSKIKKNIIYCWANFKLRCYR